MGFFFYFFPHYFVRQEIFLKALAALRIQKRQLSHHWRLFAASRALWIVAIQLLQHLEVMLLSARFAKISIYYRLPTVLIENSFNKKCSLSPRLKSTFSSFLCLCRAFFSFKCLYQLFALQVQFRDVLFYPADLSQLVSLQLPHPWASLQFMELG